MKPDDVERQRDVFKDLVEARLPAGFKAVVGNMYNRFKVVSPSGVTVMHFWVDHNWRRPTRYYAESDFFQTKTRGRGRPRREVYRESIDRLVDAALPYLREESDYERVSRLRDEALVSRHGRPYRGQTPEYVRTLGDHDSRAFALEAYSRGFRSEDEELNLRCHHTLSTIEKDLSENLWYWLIYNSFTPEVVAILAEEANQ